MLDQITPLILTRDEEVNLERTLGQLTWARDVVVVDSLSTDGTLAIAARFPNVRVLSRACDTLASQTSFGLEAVHTPWVLLLDADFFLPAAFVEELSRLSPPPATRAYQAAFVYAIGGRPLRGSLYPPRIVLLRKGHSRIWQDGHAHRVLVDGDVAMLAEKIIHDDRKSFARFVARQRRYMAEEAEKLRTADARTLSLSGRIRKLVLVAPLAAFIHALFVKGLILDGRAGLRYASERFVAEWILSVELLRRAIGGR